MRKVLIIGASGFIGQHLQAYLAAHGWQVSVSAQRAATFLPHAFVGECTDVDAIVNAAGLAHSQLIGAQQDDYHAINAEFAAQLAKAAIHNGVGRFVHLSSVKAAAYDRGSEPNCETNEGMPTDPYGLSKRRGEELLLALDWGTAKLSILRPTLVFGRAVKANLRSLIKATYRGWLPVINGSGERSLLAAEDLCSAIEVALNHDALRDPVYIIADPEPYSVERIQAAVRQAQGKPSKGTYKFNATFVRRLASALPAASQKADKLLSSECYSSALFSQATGWSAERRIEDSMADILLSLGLKHVSSTAKYDQ